MIRTIAILISFFALTTITFAGSTPPGATSGVVTVNSIGDMRDDARVSIEGHLVRQLSEDHYIIKDFTGEIEVRIDDEDFRGVDITPKIKNRLSGEVDKDTHNVTVEVDYLEIVE